MFLQNKHNSLHPFSATSLRFQFLCTSAVGLLGILLGSFSKFLDTVPGNSLPFLLEYLDLRNFFGRFSIWIFLAVCISIYSRSAIRASINVFVFFVGMVGSYYLYSNFIAGFFPRSYAMIWCFFTLLSPFLAFICWYAKGKSKYSFALSSLILACLFNMTFVYGPGYFDMRSILELAVFLLSFAVLRRSSLRASALMTITALFLAFFLNLLVPFHFG